MSHVTGVKKEHVFGGMANKDNSICEYVFSRLHYYLCHMRNWTSAKQVELIMHQLGRKGTYARFNKYIYGSNAK